jgi:hypothetical protein
MNKLQKIVDLLTKYIQNKFYGKIELSLEAGNIVNLKVTESIKI